VAFYLLGLDLGLFLLQKLAAALQLGFGQGLGLWVTLLSVVVIALFALLGFRWLRDKLLWRLRNRLIITYGFIGVIPAVLLVAMAFVTVYLLAGQFASFVVISEIDTQLRSVEAVNAAIANELAAHLERGETPAAQSLEGLKRNDAPWAHRQVCAWHGGDPLPLCATPAGGAPFPLASFLPAQFRAITNDNGHLYLRVATSLQVKGRKLTVITSEPLDKDLVEKMAANLGEITLYMKAPPPVGPQPEDPKKLSPPLVGFEDQKKRGLVVRESRGGMVLESGNEQLDLAFTAGTIPATASSFDREISFGTPLPVVDWRNGAQRRDGAAVRVQTLPSVLYGRLFASLGDFAKGVESGLLALAIVLGVIVLLALLVGARLTRSITGAVAQLYEATQHINRGDFSHRIEVRERDQLAELQSSFNSMTASLEKLIAEQREKQRLENELAIAQEVQAQLFPQQISQLESLEVHGFCRPARTVSGDYYDFLHISSDRLGLAVGDVSGKGISAALLMATIHSAVRAYIMEGIPALNAPVLAGGDGGNGHTGVEVSPSALLTLLNRQLYHTTPMEKYATLFLGMYDGRDRKLTYSNAGHLPPLLIAPNGSLRRLECGGTVVGLFDEVAFEEGTVQFGPGDLFLAYSDGVTEPENDFGEFGEARLIEIVREHLHLPLQRISEVVTAAVDDWIGANEQPDDVTLVLARAR
jgi:sigma-B regulation protein RsbU (phosphoserine phosphatase)